MLPMHMRFLEYSSLRTQHFCFYFNDICYLLPKIQVDLTAIVSCVGGYFCTKNNTTLSIRKLKYSFIASSEKKNEKYLKEKNSKYFKRKIFFFDFHRAVFSC